MTFAQACLDVFPTAELIDNRRVLNVRVADEEDGVPIQLVYMITGDGSLLDLDLPPKPYVDANIVKNGKTISVWPVKIPDNPTPNQIHAAVMADLRMEQ